MKRSQLKPKPSWKRLQRKPLKARKTALRKVTKLSLGKQKKKLLEIAKAYVRQRDGRCMMEGANGRACGGALQASHIFPEGIYHSMKFDPENIIAACYGHHIGWWHKNPLEAHNWLQKHIGQARYEYLFKLRDAYKEKQWFEAEVKELIELSKTGDFAEVYKVYRPL